MLHWLKNIKIEFLILHHHFSEVQISEFCLKLLSVEILMKFNVIPFDGSTIL